ncbi:class E sortase [Kitasatospora aburaviensis]
MTAVRPEGRFQPGADPLGGGYGRDGSYGQAGQPGSTGSTARPGPVARRARAPRSARVPRTTCSTASTSTRSSTPAGRASRTSRPGPSSRSSPSGRPSSGRAVPPTTAGASTSRPSSRSRPGRTAPRARSSRTPLVGRPDHPAARPAAGRRGRAADRRPRRAPPGRAGPDVGALGQWAPPGGRSRGCGERARPKESALVVGARFVGEFCITLGLVMLLFVSYQLWWTNVQADAAADGARNQLEQQFDSAQPAPGAPGQPAPDPAKPETFEPGKGFAIIHLPKLGLKFPIAEGTAKASVLDKGLVGHYTGTGMPADKQGNFALAAHRNTHGEPFRHINQLGKGDKIVVETATAYYTYEVTGGIPETPPSNVSVIKPVPNGSGYTQPGRYITLTTCTPEFSSKARLILFGKMTEERPRSQGKPPALTAG